MTILLALGICFGLLIAMTILVVPIFVLFKDAMSFFLDSCWSIRQNIRDSTWF